MSPKKDMCKQHETLDCRKLHSYQTHVIIVHDVTEVLKGMCNNPKIFLNL